MDNPEAVVDLTTCCNRLDNRSKTRRTFAALVVETSQLLARIWMRF